MAVPSKADQIAEANARTAQGIEPGESVNTAAIDDGGPADPGTSAQSQARPAGEPTTEARPTPIVKSHLDTRRDAIAARFRADRGQQAQEAADEISDFARSGMPPDFEEATGARPPEPEPAQDAAAAEPVTPAPKPQTVKVKVHGQEKELPLEDVIAQAQIALAADNILDAAKLRLREADSLLETTRAKVSRADQPAQHQGDANGTQITEPAPDDGASPTPGEDITKLIDRLQFGDPAEAAVLLENTIRVRSQASVAPAIEAALQSQRDQDEGQRTAKVLKDFEGQNPELASDPMARAAIEAKVLELQLEDIRTLGVDPATIPTPNNRPVTPADIANAHRFYRSKGLQVRSPADMLEKARSDFLEWKGVSKQTPADPANKGRQQVEVNVDRSARRQAIPQQPNRTVTPRPDAQRAAPPRDRSAIVNEMRATRAAPRGQVVA